MTASIDAQTANAGSPTPAEALAPFESLVGRQWWLGDASYQEFEWGVGRQSVKGRGYFVVDGKPKLVSEGLWYWHPGQRCIKGVFTATGMPVSLFDYTTRFEGDSIVSELQAYAPGGAGTSYVETWRFLDDGRLSWRLQRRTEQGLVEEMGGIYAAR